VKTRRLVVAVVWAACFLGVGLLAQNPPRDPRPAPTTAPVKAEAAGQWFSYVDGKRWTFEVGHKDIEGGPRWLNTDDNPPLPPGAAVRAARVLLPQLLPSENMEQWHVHSVALQQVMFPDAWVYVVQVMGPGPCEVLPPAPGGCGSSGGVPTMDMVVLLNARAVVPSSAKWPAK
jgi:hypothetical protein